MDEFLIKGETITLIRGVFGFTQKEMADLLGYKVHSYLSILESQNKTLSHERTRRLLEQLGLSRADLAKLNKLRNELLRKSNLTKGEYV